MTNKKFDCVKMKNDIQKEIQKTQKESSRSERSKKIWEEVRQNPVLGPYFDQVFKENEKKKSA